MGAVRELDASGITAAVRELCIEINYKIPEEMVELVKRARALEESPLGRQVLDLLIRNQELAAEGSTRTARTPATVIFLELGQTSSAAPYDAVNGGCEATATATSAGRSFATAVRPRNTGDNAPALSTPDRARDQIGSSRRQARAREHGQARDLKPADGLEGAKEFVLQAVAESGPNACPPGIIGVGIGGNFEMSAVIAKRALMRKVGQPSSDPQIAELEAELYEKCNALGLGPEALGGTQTVLAVHVETMPTHIASLPVTVNIGAAHRTGSR
jgi:fumarate hydratase subunit alpha